MQLGGFAIAAALERAGVAPEDVDEVLMGQVLQAGQGQITARQAAVAAGIPMSVHATTINKVCLSGLNTIYLADLLIRSGEAEVVVAGGMESMTQAPHLLPGARAGYRLGDATLVDSMMLDGLTCAFDQCAMGLSTERHNARAHLARAPGRLQRGEPREGGGGDQERAVRRRDRRPSRSPSARATRSSSTPTRACVPARRPSRSAPCAPPSTPQGTITAGNASQISDGGARRRRHVRRARAGAAA